MAALAAGCLLFSFWVVAQTHHGPGGRTGVSAPLPWHPPRVSGPASLAPRVTLLRSASPLGACESRIERGARQAPVVAIVGASYTAGVGPGNPRQSWAVQAAQMLRWDAVINGVSGAGYVQRAVGAAGGGGPMAVLLAQEDLDELHPALVIVQAGHDDARVPPAVERRQVSLTVEQIRDEAPAAQIALLTTFATPHGDTAALRATDRAIVTGGLAADPHAIIMDPLAGRWNYAHVGGRGLHPTAAGDQWIAGKVTAIMARHGLLPAKSSGRAPVICDFSVGANGPGHGHPGSPPAARD